jgi:hypothetical protein
MQSGAIKKSRMGQAAQKARQAKPQAKAKPANAGQLDNQQRSATNQQQPTPAKPQSPLAAKQVSNAEMSKLASRKEMAMAIGLCVLFAALFIAGRAMYDDRYYTPEEGLGYWLGLVGGVMMLLAFVYTAFKYVSKLRTRAVMKHWLTIHIFFGLVGPILIMVHSTFHFGSLNGGVAFFAMVLVVLSGIMGRFLYSKTHYGLGGRKARVKDLQVMLKLAGHKIKSERMDRFTASVLTQKQTLGNAFWELFTFGWRSRWLYFRMTETMRVHLHRLARQNGWDRPTVRQKRQEFKLQLRLYIETLRKVALFRVYERFFAFWRNAHVPLLYLLLMSGVVHVIAVHMY